MWHNAEGTTRPDNIDMTSSKKWNYVRKDIHEEQRTDEMTGEIYTVYVWQERKIAKDDWELYKAVEKNTADIDYICMMTDIDIEEGDDDE